MTIYNLFSLGYLRDHFFQNVDMYSMLFDKHWAAIAPSGIESLGFFVFFGLFWAVLLPTRLWWRDLLVNGIGVGQWIIIGFVASIWLSLQGAFSFFVTAIFTMMISWGGIIIMAGLLYVWYQLRFVANNIEGLDTLFTGIATLLTVDFIVYPLIGGGLFWGIELFSGNSIDSQMRGLLLFVVNGVVFAKIVYDLIDFAREKADYELPFIFKQGRSRISDWDL